MFKRCFFIGTAVIFMISAVACSSEAPVASASPIIAQDIMLGADDAAVEPDIPTPATFDTSENNTEALADEKEYLQKQIGSLKEKIENLQWLRDSYVQQNPADLVTKLAECDALIADAQAELTSLQNRMTRNEQNQGMPNDGEPSVSPEDIQPEAPPETPTESPAESPQQTSNEPTPIF